MGGNITAVALTNTKIQAASEIDPVIPESASEVESETGFPSVPWELRKCSAEAMTAAIRSDSLREASMGMGRASWAYQSGGQASWNGGSQHQAGGRMISVVSHQPPTSTFYYVAVDCARRPALR